MLQEGVDLIVYSLFKLQEGNIFADSLNFFIYESVKIMLLLFLMMTFMGFIRTYVPEHKIKKILSHQKWGLGNLSASIFGSLTPFCSCSSIPLFLSFLRAGVPLGITFSFLITSPLVNEYLVVLMLGFFGWKITLAYVVFGILFGTIFGVILGKMGLEKELTVDARNTESDKAPSIKHFKERLGAGLKEGVDTMKKLWLWILVGVGVGSFLHNFVPDELVVGIASSLKGWAVPIVVLLGTPLYGSCAAIVPIAVVLFQKGLPLGLALSFMMSISALSLPEAIILRKVMKLKLIAIFFGGVILGIVIIGYLFNYLQHFLL